MKRWAVVGLCAGALLVGALVGASVVMRFPPPRQPVPPGAWVLWNKTYTRGSKATGGGFTSWTVEEATESREACVDLLEGRVTVDRLAEGDVASEERPAKGAARPGVGIAFLKDLDGKPRGAETYYCLPAGTDPRPRYKE